VLPVAPNSDGTGGKAPAEGVSSGALSAVLTRFDAAALEKAAGRVTIALATIAIVLRRRRPRGVFRIRTIRLLVGTTA
jgi:hypothetical protein